jgi:hypothetical protein
MAGMRAVTAVPVRLAVEILVIVVMVAIVTGVGPVVFAAPPANYWRLLKSKMSVHSSIIVVPFVLRTILVARVSLSG